MGLLFVLVVLFLPQGLAGAVDTIWSTRCWLAATQPATDAPRLDAVARRRGRADDAGPAASSRDVSVSFNGFLAVDRPDLAVKQGELRCLIGPNGAGKTTALDLICGKTEPTAGEIRFERQPILNHLEEHEIARCRHRPQVPGAERVPASSPCGEPAGRRISQAAGRAGQCLSASAAATIREGLERLAELRRPRRTSSATPPAYLSHGQTQWLEIALLLAQDPKLILMDEPTAGMTVAGDPQDRAALQPPERRAHADRGRARHGLRQARSPRSSRSCIRASCWPKARSPRSKPDPAVQRRLSRLREDRPCLSSTMSMRFYGAQPGVASRHRSERRRRRVRQRARPQRRRQDHAPAHRSSA